MARHQSQGALAALSAMPCICATLSLPLQLATGLSGIRCACLQDPIPHMGKFLNSYKR